MLWWGPKRVCVCFCDVSVSVCDPWRDFFLFKRIARSCRNNKIQTSTLTVQILSRKFYLNGVNISYYWHFCKCWSLWLRRVQLAHVGCSCALAILCSGCGLWTGLNLRKSCLMEDQPSCGRAPPASSTVTTLFTPHKQAGRPPRFEAALCYRRNWEAHTNSHIQNDMISQLEARAWQEISTVR